MYFVQVDERINGKTYTVRKGKMTTSFEKACRKAIQRRGYIVDETRRLVGQAVDIWAPMWVGNMQNIGSGEDV